MGKKGILIRSARVFDVHSEWDGQRCDVHVEGGRILDIGLAGSLESVGEEMKGKDLCVSPSWFDLRAHFCDPGEEHREDIVSGLRSAIVGGFGDVLVMPGTSPVIQTKGDVGYLHRRAQEQQASLHASAALTRGYFGQSLE